MCETKKYSTLPENADKVLFAEDFVNHILLRLKLPLLSSGIADHRASIFNAFNSHVRLAANYLYEHLEDDILLDFINISMKNGINFNAFLKYIVPLQIQTLELILPLEFGAKSLMQFCVKISTMAAYFYQHEFLEAPDLAVDCITNIMDDIDMVEAGGWNALDIVAAGYTQDYIDRDKHYLTPNSDFDLLSPDTSSRGNSDASPSPDHEMDDEDDQDEHLEKLTDSNFCKMCIAAMSFSSEGPVYSISVCKHVEKTIDVISENIVSFSDSTSDSVSSESSKEKNSEASFPSLIETLSENETSKLKIRKKQKRKPFSSYSKNSDSDPDKNETDPKKTDSIDQFGRELTEKLSAILSSPINELHELDSEQHFKASCSDNLTDDKNTSSRKEGDIVQSSCTKSFLMQKPVSKRRK